MDVSNPSGVDLEDSYEVMMAANLVHITDWSNVVAFFELAGEKLAKTNGILFLYGPFAFQERFTFVHLPNKTIVRCKLYVSSNSQTVFKHR